MAAVELNLKPTDKQLRQFGLIGLFAMPIIGWVFSGKPSLNLIPSGLEPNIAQRLAIFTALGAAMGVCAWLKPSLLKWVFIVASVVTFPIGFVLGEITMFLIYLIGFVPMAILFRVIGRDALDRKFDKEAETYWQKKEPPKDSASYYRQS